MSDEILMSELKAFVSERDWGQFHSLENLAKSISTEAAELLELFQWGSTDDTRKIQHELADVLTYCYLLADKLGVNPRDIVLEKLKESARKYPVELSRGRSEKYDRL